MKVQPIHKLKDVRAIRKLIADSPRDSAIFTIGINTNLRASDILRLTIGQMKDIKPGHEIEIIEKKTKKRPLPYKDCLHTSTANTKIQTAHSKASAPPLP